MPKTFEEVMRDTSKLLCGAKIRLPIAAWIRSQPVGTSFYQRQVASGIGASRQYMGRELDILCQLEMIQRLDRSEGDRRTFYLAIPSHPLWSVIDAVVVACTQITEPGSVTAIPPERVWPIGDSD